MSQRLLGLPLEYQKLPEYFDAWNTHADTESKNAVIEKILKGYHVKSVLDLTCGTGSQVFFLKKHGYHVTGSDFSQPLLDQARAKALKNKIDVTFIHGDMRTVKAGKFDAVITIFNAIGHLTKSGFEKAIRNIDHCLHPGGIYIFDIFNLEAMTDEALIDLACSVHKKVGDTQILATQCSTLDRSQGVLTSYDHILIQHHVQPPQRLRHQFSLQIYTAQELREMLARNGFSTEQQCGFDGSAWVREKTQSILTVARKNGGGDGIRTHDTCFHV